MTPTPTTNPTRLDIQPAVASPKKKRIVVITSSPDYTTRQCKDAEIDLSYVSSLNGSMREWIDERIGYSDNKDEIRFAKALSEAGITFQQQVYFYINTKQYFLDFYLPQLKLAIEIDGSFHDHRRKGYDKRRDEKFKKIGIRTIRIPASYKFDGEYVFTLISEGLISRYFNQTMKCNEENIKRVANLLKDPAAFLNEFDIK